MVRDLMLGQVDAGILVHVAYLTVMGAIGTAWTARRIESLLLR